VQTAMAERFMRAPGCILMPSSIGAALLHLVGESQGPA
jgi:hypothetical protein